jgi:hypothetical protein
VKSEIWLNTNRRACLVLAILPGICVFACAIWFIFATTPLSFWLGVLAFGPMALWLASTLYRMRQPRLAFKNGRLLVYLGGLQAIQVPIDIVECFFLGQGPSMLPRSLEGKHGEAAETATIVVRLAESAREWHHRDVLASLGQWCEGYITIRGTWCEPLTREVVARLNQRLVEAHREARRSADETVTA